MSDEYEPCRVLYEIGEAKIMAWVKSLSDAQTLYRLIGAGQLHVRKLDLTEVETDIETPEKQTEYDMSIRMESEKNESGQGLIITAKQEQAKRERLAEAITSKECEPCRAVYETDEGAISVWLRHENEAGILFSLIKSQSFKKRILYGQGVEWDMQCTHLGTAVPA